MRLRLEVDSQGWAGWSAFALRTATEADSERIGKIAGGDSCSSGGIPDSRTGVQGREIGVHEDSWRCVSAAPRCLRRSLKGASSRYPERTSSWNGIGLVRGQGNGHGIGAAIQAPDVSLNISLDECCRRRRMIPRDGKLEASVDHVSGLNPQQVGEPPEAGKIVQRHDNGATCVPVVGEAR